ncbi:MULTISPECIES: hypothetical protein [Brevibacillus]|uniref:hypothetical protein n=1 Tax=Brevibacillus TaxID=55080 RepID=UPI0013751C0F|nr:MULTISPECIES: hypothetical protein [Brevibacillus]MED1789065.1 hypothetical protein [Brevibacillus laterosporus]
MTNAEKQRAIALGEQLGIEVTFDNKEPGIFIGDIKMSFEELFKDWFDDLNKEGKT